MDAGHHPAASQIGAALSPARRRPGRPRGPPPHPLHRRRTLVRARPAHPPGACRCVDVRRRPPRAAAAVAASAGDGGRGRPLRIQGRPVGTAAAHQRIPCDDDVRHRRRRAVDHRPHPCRTRPRVRSRAGRAPVRASDPHLLRWVHIAEIDSFLRAYQRYGSGTLDAAQRDGYVADTARVAAALGVTDPPRTERELADAARGLPSRTGRHPGGARGRAVHPSAGAGALRGASARTRC